MASDSVLVDKCLRFSVRMVKLYKYLTEEQKEYILSKQLLRSATSIGANSNEAVYAASRNDFINKMHIAILKTAKTDGKETDNR